MADIVNTVVDDTDNFHKPLVAVVVDENSILDCVHPYKDTVANTAVDVDVDEDVEDDDAVDVHVDNYVDRQDTEDFDFVYSFQLFKNLLYFIMVFIE